jgi:hypothetical protein
MSRIQVKGDSVKRGRVGRPTALYIGAFLRDFYIMEI